MEGLSQQRPGGEDNNSSFWVFYLFLIMVKVPGEPNLMSGNHILCSASLAPCKRTKSLWPLSSPWIISSMVVTGPFQGRLGGSDPVLRSDLGGECVPWGYYLEWLKTSLLLTCGIQSTVIIKASLVFQTSAGSFTRMILPSQGQLLNIFLIPDLCSHESVKENRLGCSWAGVY